jgi:hypothetical protein
VVAEVSISVRYPASMTYPNASFAIASAVRPSVLDDDGSEVAEAREISALSPVAPDTYTAEPFGIVVPVVFLTRNRTTCALVAAVAPVIAAWSMVTVMAVVPLAEIGDVPTTPVT